jgi:hypothetical protein
MNRRSDDDDRPQRKGPRRPLPQDVARLVLEQATALWNDDCDEVRMRVRGRQMRVEPIHQGRARSVGREEK